MSAPECVVQRSGRVELFHYGELAPADRGAVEAHLDGCAECRQALADLRLVESALAARPQVAAPPDGDWTAFMSRLDRAVAAEATGGAIATPRHRSWAQLLAMAALLALVTASLFFAARTGEAPGRLQPAASDEAAGHDVMPPATPAGRTVAILGEQHLERSKLVLLGLTSKDADRTASRDWLFERELASRLLADTRLYRQAAEEQGLARMAGVMRDLEFVLIQASMTEGRNQSELSQIQRAISKRDLLYKMDAVRAAN